MYQNQKGVAHILMLFAAIGLIGFILVSSAASFKDKLFGSLYPKPSSQASEATVKASSIPGEILVKFRTGVDDHAKQNVRSEHGLSVLETLPQIGVERLKVPEQVKEKVLQALSNNPNVEFAEPNFPAEQLDTPNDPLYYLDDFHYGGQWNLFKIQASEAWNISQGDPSVVVAVLDNGVMANHVDLLGKVTDTGYNVAENNNNTNSISYFTHGTSVAGIIGAVTNNGLFVASLGRNVRIQPIKVTDSEGFSTYSILANGIIYATDHEAKVINISMGNTTSSRTLDSAVNYAWKNNKIVVGSAGNTGTCCQVYYPGASTNAIAVGASSPEDTREDYSTYGSAIDLVAPGTVRVLDSSDGITSLYAGGTGTSFSSPHVSALAALIYSVNPNLTNQQVVDIMTSTAVDLGTPGKDNETGYGRINAFAALTKAVNTTSVSSTPTPTKKPRGNSSR
jgi:thermitase